MSKAQLSAALTLVTIFGLPVAAHATAPTFSHSSASVIFSEPEDGDDGEEAEDVENYDDQEDGEDVYDDGDQDSDDSAFVVPPLVVHPDGGKGHGFKDPGAHIPDDKAFGDAGAPVDGAPIQLERVAPSPKTPTDVFVDTAMIGLGAVGAGALTLGGMVGVRAIRAKRSGQKADYFYGD